MSNLNKENITPGLTIYSVLGSLGINYVEYKHPAVFTTQESSRYEIDEEAARCKNLFLRDKRKSTYYLVVLESAKQVGLDVLAEQLEEKKLSFASEEDLTKYLGVESGAVSPFALINNVSKNVVVIVDEDMVAKEKVSFHPNVNTATLVIATEDFKKYLGWTKNQVKFMNLGK